MVTTVMRFEQCHNLEWIILDNLAAARESMDCFNVDQSIDGTRES